MGGQPAAPGGGNCTLTGGLQFSDLGVAKLAKLKNLKRLNISGARLTPEGLQVLQSLPLERLSVWASASLDDAAADVLAGMPTLAHLDMSYTKIGDQGLQRLGEAAEPEGALPDRNQRHSGSGCSISEAASQHVRLLGEATGAARGTTDGRETRHRGNANDRSSLRALSLALILFVSMMAAPRPQAQSARSGSRVLPVAGVSRVRSREVQRLPRGVRRRVGHAAALSRKGRDAGADSGIRSLARRRSWIAPMRRSRCC